MTKYKCKICKKEAVGYIHAQGYLNKNADIAMFAINYLVCKFHQKQFKKWLIK